MKKEAEKILQSMQTEYDNRSDKDDIQNMMINKQESQLWEDDETALSKKKKKRPTTAYKTYKDFKDSFKLIQHDIPAQLQSP